VPEAGLPVFARARPPGPAPVGALERLRRGAPVFGGPGRRARRA